MQFIYRNWHYIRILSLTNQIYLPLLQLTLKKRRFDRTTVIFKMTIIGSKRCFLTALTFIMKFVKNAKSKQGSYFNTFATAEKFFVVFSRHLKFTHLKFTQGC